jgi:RNA polymerase sigma-70 factor (ECF subfamily)
MLSMDSRTDLDLLTAIQEHADATALGALYDRFGRKVYALAYGILRCKPDAEDVLQEVFERVWKKSHTYQSALGNVKSWLLRITHNRSINRLKARAIRATPIGYTSDATYGDSVAGGMPENIFDASEIDTNFDIGEFVRKALAYLPEEQRRLIELAFFKGLSHSEIAETEQLPLGTVKTRIRTGITRLRSELKFLKT